MAIPTFGGPPTSDRPPSPVTAARAAAGTLKKRRAGNFGGRPPVSNMVQYQIGTPPVLQTGTPPTGGTPGYGGTPGTGYGAFGLLAGLDINALAAAAAGRLGRR